MNIKKWLILVGTLALALGIAGAVTAFALAADGSKDNPAILDDADGAADATSGLPSYDEGETDSRGGTVVTSIDDIDPNVCNGFHNIKPVHLKS